MDKCDIMNKGTKVLSAKLPYQEPILLAHSSDINDIHFIAMNPLLHCSESLNNFCPEVSASHPVETDELSLCHILIWQSSRFHLYH